METSYNGWPVIRPDSAFPRLRRFKVPGSKTVLPMRDGSAGFLLAFVATRLDQYAEEIDTGQTDDWGYAFRDVRGYSNKWSCHASGTAFDFNAPKHSLGRRGTWRHKAKVYWAMRRTRNCVGWGGDYSNRADEMHFEIKASMETCERKARRLVKSKNGKRILAANPGLEEVIFS